MSRKKSSKQQANPLTHRGVQLGLALAVVIAIIAVLAIALGGDNSSDGSATYTTLNATDAFARFSENAEAVIVDVRDSGEWRTTGIPTGAVTYSLNEQLRQSLPPEDLLPKDKEIFVICNSGNRSQEASQILIDNGYSDVVNIDGGIIAWVNNGLPIEPYMP